MILGLLPRYTGYAEGTKSQSGPGIAQIVVHALVQIPMGVSVAASVRVGNALGAGNTEQAIMSSKLYVIVGGMCETQLYINCSLIYVSFSSWCLIFAILYCPLLPISTITSHFHPNLPDSYSGMHYCSCTRSLEGRDWIHFHYRPVSKKTSSLSIFAHQIKI